MKLNLNAKYYILVVLLISACTPNKNVKVAEKVIIKKEKKEKPNDNNHSGGLKVSASSAHQIYLRAGMYLELSYKTLNTVCQRRIWQVKLPCRLLTRFVPLLQKEYDKGRATMKMENLFFYFDSYLGYILKFKNVYPDRQRKNLKKQGFLI